MVKDFEFDLESYWTYFLKCRGKIVYYNRLDDILKVSKQSAVDDRTPLRSSFMVTPAQTPDSPTAVKQSTSYLPRPLDIKEQCLYPLVSDIEFGFFFQYTWPVGEIKDIAANIVSVYPRTPSQWLTLICPQCLAFDNQECSCFIPRNEGYVLSLDLRSQSTSLLSLTAFISGSAAFEIFQKISPQQLMSYVNDGKKYLFKILKFTPQIITSVPYGFLILDID
jgi:hypothetical protein